MKFTNGRWPALIAGSVALVFTASSGDGGSGGGWTGGGGDPVKIRMEEARLLAADMVKGLGGKAIESLDPEVRKWLKENQQALSDDIRSSEPEWTHETRVTCAHTDGKRNAKITLSLPTCRRSLFSVADAVKLRIHESTHHLGLKDEALADRIAVAVFDTTTKQNSDLLQKRVVLCPTIQDPRSVSFGYRSKVATKLMGRWKLDRKILKRLGREMKPGSEEYLTGVEFTEDLKALDNFPPNGYCAHTAGYFSWRTNKGIGKFKFMLMSDGEQFIVRTLQGPKGEEIGVNIVNGRIPKRVHPPSSDDYNDWGGPDLLVMGGTDPNDAQWLFVREGENVYVDPPSSDAGH